MRHRLIHDYFDVDLDIEQMGIDAQLVIPAFLPLRHRSGALQSPAIRPCPMRSCSSWDSTPSRFGARPVSSTYQPRHLERPAAREGGS